MGVNNFRSCSTHLYQDHRSLSKTPDLPLEIRISDKSSRDIGLSISGLGG